MTYTNSISCISGVYVIIIYIVARAQASVVRYLAGDAARAASLPGGMKADGGPRAGSVCLLFIIMVPVPDSGPCRLSFSIADGWIKVGRFAIGCPPGGAEGRRTGPRGECLHSTRRGCVGRCVGRTDPSVLYDRRVVRRGAAIPGARYGRKGGRRKGRAKGRVPRRVAGLGNSSPWATGRALRERAPACRCLASGITETKREEGSS